MVQARNTLGLANNAVVADNPIAANLTQFRGRSAISPLAESVIGATIKVPVGGPSLTLGKSLYLGSADAGFPQSNDRTPMTNKQGRN